MATLDNNLYKKELEKWAAQTQKALRKKLSWTTSLKKNIFVEVSDSVGINLIMPEHWMYIEKGRRPNKKAPPMDVIYDWSKSKRLPQFRDKKGRYISHESRAFIIARSIGIKGIKPKPFLYVYNKEINKLPRVIQDKFVEDLFIDLDKI